MRAGADLQAFLVAAVVSILFIRLTLGLFDFPQLGGARLHIAHVLWGGLLMLAAIVLLLSFVAREVHRVAALIGGIGFGTFIDEVGKLVTRDNDYFFRPAVAMIYVVFVLLYLAIRAIHTVRSYSPREYLVNALIQMEDVAVHDLDETEAKRLSSLLDRSDPGHPLVPALRAALAQAQVVPTPRSSLPTRIARWVGDRYRRLASLRFFPALVLGVFVTELLLKILATARLETPTLIDWLKYGSWLLSAVFLGHGIGRIRVSRLDAFRDLEVSVLIAIFITHVFSFYKDQFLALSGLSASILLLISVRFMIRQERARSRNG
jgi:hypothetical protein